MVVHATSDSPASESRPRLAAQPVGGVALVEQREADVGRLVHDVAVDVGLAELVAAQGGAAPRAVGHHLDVLVEEALVPELFRFHHTDSMYSGRERPVGVVDVDPVADPLGQQLPFADVVAHRLAAQAGELGDAHLFLDLALVGDAQLLFHLDLDRQAVGVPPRLPGHGVAPHGPVPAEQVLVDPGPHVVQTGTAVGRGRPLVEDPGLGPRPELDRPLEDAVLAPPGQLLGLEGGEIGFGGDRAEQRVPPRGTGGADRYYG